MSDIRAVDWLPLNAAIERLSRDSERVFLETVGPLAMSALAEQGKAAQAKEAARRRRRGRCRGRRREPLSSACRSSCPPNPMPETEEPALGAEPLDETGDGRRRSFAQRMRGWLGRVARCRARDRRAAALR